MSEEICKKLYNTGSIERKVLLYHILQEWSSGVWLIVVTKHEAAMVLDIEAVGLSHRPLQLHCSINCVSIISWASGFKIQFFSLRSL